MTHVFMLWHFRDEDDDETWKLVGVYSSRENAEAAKARKLTFPGFWHYPDGFKIDSCKVDLDLWSEGFGEEDIP